MTSETKDTARIVSYHDRAMQMLDTAGVEHSGRTLPERVAELIDLSGRRTQIIMKGIHRCRVAEQERDRQKATIDAVIGILESWPPSEWGYRENQMHELLTAAQKGEGADER